MNKLPLRFSGALICGALLISGAALPTAGLVAGVNAHPTFYRTFRPPNINGFASAQAENVIATRDGGVLGIGRNSSTDPAHPGVYNHLGWLIKLAPDGSRQWEHTYFIDASDPGITHSLVLHYAAQLPDAGFLVLGGVSQKKGALWLLRTDAAGAPQSLRRIGLGMSLIPDSIVPAASDGALIFFRKIGEDITRPTAAPVLLRVNSAGAVIWQRQLGAASGDVLNDAVALPDGGFLVAGGHTPPGAVSPWLSQSFLARLDSSGGIVWQKSLSGTLACIRIDRIVALPDGSYMAALYLGNRVAFARLAADGTLLTVKTYQPDLGPYDYIIVRTFGLIRRADATLVALVDVVGARRSFNQPIPSFSYSSHIIKIDTAGTQLWHKSISDTVPFQSMAAFGGGQLMVGSYSGSGGAHFLATDSVGEVDDSCSIPEDSSYPEVAMTYTAVTTTLASTVSAVDIVEVSVTATNLGSTETGICTGVIPPTPTADPRLTQKIYLPLARR